MASHGILPPDPRVALDFEQRSPLPKLSIFSQLMQRTKARDDTLVLRVGKFERNLIEFDGTIQPRSSSGIEGPFETVSLKLGSGCHRVQNVFVANFTS